MKIIKLWNQNVVNLLLFIIIIISLASVEVPVGIDCQAPQRERV